MKILGDETIDWTEKGGGGKKKPEQGHRERNVDNPQTQGIWTLACFFL